MHESPCLFFFFFLFPFVALALAVPPVPHGARYNKAIERQKRTKKKRNPTYIIPSRPALTRLRSAPPPRRWCGKQSGGNANGAGGLWYINIYI
ncbi:hypothetical protein DFJ77DRAFT_449906 [Powellomyces hirtus]|nr:hypothetical protein DFJ77DRAFT_449906 [Powellomyces hirtus]